MTITATHTFEDEVVVLERRRFVSLSDSLYWKRNNPSLQDMSATLCSRMAVRNDASAVQALYTRPRWYRSN